MSFFWFGQDCVCAACPLVDATVVPWCLVGAAAAMYLYKQHEEQRALSNAGNAIVGTFTRLTTNVLGAALIFEAQDRLEKVLTRKIDTVYQKIEKKIDDAQQ